MVIDMKLKDFSVRTVSKHLKYDLEQ